MSLVVLRELRAVATPEAARSLVPVMMKDRVGRKEIESAIRQAIHDMYVDWAWCSDNNFIHPERCMFHSLPFVAVI